MCFRLLPRRGRLGQEPPNTGNHQPKTNRAGGIEIMGGSGDGGGGGGSEYDNNNNNKQKKKLTKKEKKEVKKAAAAAKAAAAGKPKRAVTQKESDSRERRAARFEREGSSQVAKDVSIWDPEEHKIKKRQVTRALEEAARTGVEADLSAFVVVGTSGALQKPYLRLTSAPDPAKVRPEKVLRKSLEMVLARHKAVENADSEKKKKTATSPTYLWACEQFKSIRQDLTVQHIHNDFAVGVYESHARLAIEHQDMKEFNQCQTQLQGLYASGTHGSSDEKDGSPLGTPERHAEFAAYRILYTLYTTKKYNTSSSGMAMLLQSIPPALLTTPAVLHALNVQAAVDQADFGSFFRLYRLVPNMGVHLLDLILGYARHLAIQRVTRAFRPYVSVDMVKSLLMFSEDGGLEGTAVVVDGDVERKKRADEMWQAFVEESKITIVEVDVPSVVGDGVGAGKDDTSIDDDVKLEDELATGDGDAAVAAIEKTGEEAKVEDASATAGAAKDQCSSASASAWSPVITMSVVDTKESQHAVHHNYSWEVLDGDNVTYLEVEEEEEEEEDTMDE